MSGHFSFSLSLSVVITLSCKFYMTCLCFHLLVKCGHFCKSLRIGPNRLNRILTAEVEEVDEVRNANDLSYCPHNDVELDQYKNSQYHCHQQDNVQDQQTLVYLTWELSHCLYVCAAICLQGAVVHSSTDIVGHQRLDVWTEGS